jgi:hypothetical protein
MTDEEWIAARVAEAPRMSESCRNELALILREQPRDAKVDRGKP